MHRRKSRTTTLQGHKLLVRGFGLLNGGQCGSQQQHQSVFGVYPKFENLTRKHDAPGIMSMIKPSGPEFTIAPVELPDYDKIIKNTPQVVFGKVVEGLDVAKAIGKKSKPFLTVITDCGELKDFPPNVSSFDQLASTSNKQLSNSLKEIMNVNKQLIAADPKDVLTPESERELVESAEIFQPNLQVR